MDAKARNPFRQLPQVERLLQAAEVERLTVAHGRPSVLAVLRLVLEEARVAIADGEAVPSHLALIERVACRLEARSRPGLRKVINATGIVLHTNLGRAPMSDAALAAVADVSAGYCSLEFDLESGRRGSRTGFIEPLLREVAGCEAALPVNNGAAAILLALSALAVGGEVIVSRGELVEIGGGFRIPDVIRQGGARLVEVGSTNKTRLADYRAAITSETRILLKVHQSNYRTIGFTAETTLQELSGLAREYGLLVVNDLGSGLLRPTPGASEPTAAEALAAGADLVTCSGDKLLGGPQAGLVLGSKAAVEPLRKHPLLRAVRLDKMSLAALEATLRLWRDDPTRIPVVAMLAATAEGLEGQARRLRDLVGKGDVEVSEAYAGGGSLPEELRESRALVLDPPCGAEAASARLRAGNPAVAARIHRGRLVVDLLTVSEAEIADLAAALRAVLG